MADAAAYAGLFLLSFVAATLLPAQSELAIGTLHHAGGYPALPLLLAATVGNVLGSLVNWWLGRFLVHFQDRRWFPVSPAQMERATRWFQRFGTWSLLLAWLPVVGDPLTLVAGVLRVPLPWFVLLVTVGKAARYAAILGAV